MRWLKFLFSPYPKWERPKPIPLRMDFQSSSLGIIDSKKVATVQFRGIAENSHERCHIYEAMQEALLKVFTDKQPNGLILDLRELEYSWGDDMGRILCPVSELDVPDIPVVVITSELNREGLTSLVRDEMLSKPACWLVQSEEQARALMQSKLRHEERQRQRKASRAGKTDA